MKIAESVALVTGADRGPGRHFASQLVQRGARTVYAVARPGADIDIPGVSVLTTDEAEPDTLVAAARSIDGVTLLVNTGDSPVSADPAADAGAVRRQLDADYFSLLRLIGSFAPALEAGARGAVVNVISTPSPQFAVRGQVSAAPAAAPGSLLITAVLFGLERTDVITEVDLTRDALAAVVCAVLDGIEAGDVEIIPDILAAHARTGHAVGSIQTYRPLL